MLFKVLLFAKIKHFILQCYENLFHLLKNPNVIVGLHKASTSDCIPLRNTIGFRDEINNNKINYIFAKFQCLVFA